MKTIRTVSCRKGNDSFFEVKDEKLIWTNHYAFFINDPQLEQAIKKADPGLIAAATEQRHTFYFDSSKRGYNGLIATPTDQPSGNLDKMVKQHDIVTEVERFAFKDRTSKIDLAFLKDTLGNVYAVAEDVHDYLINMCGTQNVWKAHRNTQDAALYFDKERNIRGLLLPVRINLIDLI